ncbi:MAG: AAA family ATPase [Lachnospiraceae bacterium]|nr:AAA family ATPase [Lachnospiraceae bacterium]
MGYEDKLYILMQELNRAVKKELITRAAMERVLAPLAGMNEKLQDSYAEEMIPVLRTSGDEEEVLVRMQLCIQLISEGAVMEGGDGRQKGGGKKKIERENSEEKGSRKTKIVASRTKRKEDGKIAAGQFSSGLDRLGNEEEDDTGIYLYRFTLPIDNEEEMYQDQAWQNGGKFGYVDNAYPCGIFDRKKLSEIIFSKITIFYGGNGSGKSTLLNLIAGRLNLNRVAPYNSGEIFDRYREECRYELGHDEEGFALRIPSGSRIITSDDVFDYMLAMRTRNEEIAGGKQAAREEYAKLKYGESVKFKSMDDYDTMRQQILARSRSVSRRQFIRRTAGEEVELGSNGETALAYFERKIKTKTLYCLDEPENSLSPAMQLELVKLLEKRAGEEECQFIMATHSPFLLAMQGAKVYNLDACPAQVCPWWELENVRIYYEFFREHGALFF